MPSRSGGGYATLSTCARSSGCSSSIRDRRSCQDVARTDDVLGIKAVLVGKGQEQPLVAHQVIEDAEEEIRVAGGIPDRFRPDAGGGEEPAKPFRLARDEAQRRYRKRSGGLLLFPRINLAPAGEGHDGIPW